MQLTLALAVLAALVIAEDCPRQPVTGAWGRLLLALGGMLAVGLFALVSSRWIARGIRRESDRRGKWLLRFRRLRQVHSLLWLLVAGGVLYGLGWGQLVRFNWRLDRLFLVDHVLILLPVVLPLVVSWAAFYEVDRALRLALVEGTADSPEVTGRGRYVLMQVRHFLALLLLPLLAVLAVQDAAERLAPRALQGASALAIYALPLLLLLALFPVMLRYVWQTRPLAPAALRERLETAARRARFRCREILVWETGGMMVNAAVAGFLPPLRYVFLSDGLLSHLGDEEIAAVFAHEMGHVRHRHLLLRIATIVLPLSIWLLFAHFYPSMVQRLALWCTTGGLGRQLTVGLASLAAVGSYVGLVFGAVSRLLEHQADLFGCRVFEGDGQERSIGAMVSALERLAYVSGIDHRWKGWQHASIARRVEFLSRAASDPLFEQRFHRRLRLLGGLIIALDLSPLAAYLLL
jgi:STE24 endopeptidase